MLQQLPITARWMYLGLLLSAGDHNNQCITFTSASLQQLSIKGVPYTKLLLLLEQYQLVTVVKYPSLEVFNKEIKEVINKGEPPRKEPAKDFQNISNPTELQNIALTKAAEFLELDKIFGSEHAFGSDFPPALRKGKTNFYSRILISYDFNMTDVRRDMNSIINEGLLEKIPASSKSDYIATRVKKKALEVYNATR